MEIAFFIYGVYLGAIKGIYLGGIKGIYLGGIKGILSWWYKRYISWCYKRYISWCYKGVEGGGRIRVLTHFSLSYRFPIILPVSELVVYRVFR